MTSQKLFSVVVFSIPFLAVSPLIKFYGIPVGVFFGVLVLVTALLLIKEKGLSIDILKGTPLNGLLLLYVLISLVSLGRAALAGGLGEENLLRFAYLCFSVVVFWVTANVVTNRETFSRVVSVYFIASFISVLWSLYVTVGFMAGLETGQPVTWTVPRLFGTSAEPQVYGNYLVSVIPLLTAFILVKTPLFKKVAPVFTLLTLLVLALLMTFSAGAWAGLAAGWLLLLAGFRYFNFRGIAAFAGSIAVVIAALVLVNAYLFPGYLEGFKSIAVKFGIRAETVEQTVQTGPGPQGRAAFTAKETYHLSEKTVTEREGFRAAAWQMFRTHPVLGVGTGNFGYLYNTYNPAWAEDFPFAAKAHNQYLEILAETGMLGFAVFLLIVFRIFVLAGRSFRNSRDYFWKAGITGTLASLTGIAVQGYSFGFLVHIYTWFLLGLLVSACRQNAPEEAH